MKSAFDSGPPDLGKPNAKRPQRLSYSKLGMVTSAHYLATEAGNKILEEGGNAVDAAVATAFALGVCEPQASGLGGQTMAVAHFAETKTNIAFDGSSRAPNRATPDSLEKSDRRRGYTATTVPSTPATLAYLVEKHGTKTLAEVLAPAITIAEDGFVVSELFHSLSKREAKFLRKRSGGAFYLKNGRAYPLGGNLKQPVLAKTLKRLAKAGIEDFYQGRIARQIHQDMKAHGGLLQKDDLAQIPWPIERDPVSGRFANMKVVSMPPPGAGRVLLEMLQILEKSPEKLWDPDTPKGALFLAEVMRQAALDRADRPYDPNFFAQVEEKEMLSRDYAGRVAKQLQKRIQTRGETTHLSVMDRHGNAVALTQSIENVFGSCEASPELGFLYNNYMSAYEHEDISHPYYLRPNANPWASVAPTIVFKNRKPWLTIGSPGSERIVSAIMLTMLRLRHQSPFQAVDGPRLHCSVKGRVSLESSRFRDDIPELLEKRGFEVDHRDAHSFYLGCVQLVMMERGGFTGVADPRRDGSAQGPKS